MQSTLRAELWDKLHFILGHSTDRMIRGELLYDGLIQTGLLKKALLHVTETHTVLHSSFRDHFLYPYWEIRTYSIDDILTVIHTDDPGLARDDFMNQVIPADNNVQYKAAVINHDGRSLFCVMINHMCLDGRTLHTFLYQVAFCYNRIYEGLPLPVFETGSRAHSMIYSNLPFRDRIRARLLLRNITRLKEKRTFAYTGEDPSDHLQTIRQKWEDVAYEKMRETAKKTGFTVNDMLLACYIHALYETCDFPAEKPLTITCMVDNRRHIKQSAKTGLTNHVGLLQVRIVRCGATIGDTIRRVHEVTTREKKKRFFGLQGIPLISLGYVSPFFLVKPGTLRWFVPPVLGFSNLGIIQEGQLKLGDLQLSDIMLVGPSQFKPNITIYIHTVSSTLDFTTAVRGNEKDREKILQLFTGMKKHMKELSGESPVKDT
jgi:NRPS condensation-like uncharacterized protein